jgi:hypothetical protein
VRKHASKLTRARRGGVVRERLRLSDLAKEIANGISQERDISFDVFQPRLALRTVQLVLESIRLPFLRQLSISPGPLRRTFTFRLLGSRHDDASGPPEKMRFVDNQSD